MKPATHAAGPGLTFNNRRGERVEATPVTATEAKKNLGQVLDTVIRGGAVVITKHDAPTAVLVSVEEFTALSQRSKLNILDEYFDSLYDQMQTPAARAAMQAAFDATPQQLGEAAVAAARKRT